MTSPCRTLSEFWHWFVANVPGDSVDDGNVIFDLLFPLVLPEGDGNHRQVISLAFHENIHPECLPGQEKTLAAMKFLDFKSLIESRINNKHL